MPPKEYSNSDSHHTFSLQGSISRCPGPQGLTLLLERSISICYLYPESTSPSLGLGRGAGPHKQQQQQRRLQRQNQRRGSWRLVGRHSDWTLVPDLLLASLGGALRAPTPQRYHGGGCE